MNIAICFLTNENKDLTIPNYIYEKLNKVTKNNSNNYDIYRLLNVNQYSHRKYNNLTYEFTWEDLRKKYNHVDKWFYKEYMGVCDLPLFYLQENQPDYDYYIFYEDDLYFTGFNKNLNPFEKIYIKDYDIIFSYPRKYRESWYWCSKYAYNLPNGWIPYEGLLNCYIISNKALKDLKEFCCNGEWHGHHELVVNSFFYNQKDKYKIGNINNYYKTRIFLNDIELKIYLRNNNIITENIFLHPIKENNMLTKVKNIYPEIK